LGAIAQSLGSGSRTGLYRPCGEQYRFSEFLSSVLANPSYPVASERRRWQEMAAQFASYPQLTIEERQHLKSNPLVSTPAEDGAMGRGTMGETSIKNQKPKIKTKLPLHSGSVQLS